MEATPGAAPGDAAPAGADVQPRMPCEGLSLAALKAFVESHRGRNYQVAKDAKDASAGLVMRAFEELTTAEVVAAVVKPATVSAGAGGVPGTYAELLLATVRACRVPCPATR